MPCLILRAAGGDVVRQFAIEGDETIVGRADACDMQVDDPALSKRHFAVTRVGEQEYVIRDLRSTNGTKVNGSRVESADLKAGDRITAGGSTFVFVPGLETVIVDLAGEEAGYKTMLGRIVDEADGTRK